MLYVEISSSWDHNLQSHLHLMSRKNGYGRYKVAIYKHGAPSLKYSILTIHSHTHSTPSKPLSMALPQKTLSFLFLAIFLLSHQIHARDSQFFSKVTNDINPKETTTTTTVVNPRNDNNNQKQVEQDPTFIPETQNNGYGLYGHESGQFPPSETEHFTTTKTTTGTPYTTTSTTPVSTYEPHTTPTTYKPYTTPTTYEPYTTPTTYEPYTTPVGRPYRTESEEDNKYNNAQFYNNDNKNSYYYNNENEERSETRGYNNYYNKRNTNNGGNDRSYNTERKGMSDTRFLENGKYFYDLNNEKHYDPNSYRKSSVGEPIKNNWYNNNRGNNNYYNHNSANDRSYENNKNSFEGYQNQDEDQFQENDDEFVP